MLDFALSISRNGTDFYTLDLFPDQQLNYEVDFYDSLSLDKIKLPFSTSMKLPLTTGNMSADRMNYNPFSSDSLQFPTEEFFFELSIFGAAVSELTGFLTVSDIEYNSSEPYIGIELKDQLSYYLAKIKEVNMAELYDQPKYTDTSLTLKKFANYTETNTSIFGQQGQIGVQPDPDAAIVFPYVDMNNDLEKYKYPARQFLEYGTGIKRCGLIPAFSVNKFLEYVGDYLSTSAFPVRVDSKLFGIGEFDGNPHDADFHPEKLRFTNSSHLLAKQSVNTRTFTLNQALAWVGTNASMEYMEGTETTFKYNTGNSVNNERTTKWFRTSYWGNMEIHGNAGGVTSTQFEQREFGVKKQMTSYPESTNENIRGWFCPKVSYNANLRLNGNPALPVEISGLELEIPVCREDGLVVDIQSDNSLTTMEFSFNVGVYEDGMMIKKIALEDANGDELRLRPSGRNYNGGSNKNDVTAAGDYFTEDDDITLAWNSPSLGIRDVLEFADVDVYFPTDVDVFVNGGSRYSINYFLEPVDGVVQARVITEFVDITASNPNMRTGNGTTPPWVDFDQFDLKKLVTRIGTISEAQELAVTFLANEDFLPHQESDEIVIKDSIAQTTEDTIYEALLKISKRFNCGLFYDYDTVNSVNVLRIDPLHVMRSGTQDISTMINDAASFKVSRGGSRIKNLTLSNEDYDRYFDDENNDGVTTGSTTQEINSEGIEDLEIKLDSAVFYKSLCGDETVERPQNLLSGAFSEEQLGLAKNIFSQNDKAGFRFGYVKAPNYNTWLLHPMIAFNPDSTFSGAMKTETERIYSKGSIGFGELSGSDARVIFNGEMTHVSPSGFDLRAEDEDGVTTDYYELYSAGEGLKTANLPVVEFDMVVPTSTLSNLDFFMQTLTAPMVTNNDIYVKSAKGKVYGDFAYLTIEALID
jgi:hypothetical protein